MLIAGAAIVAFSFFASNYYASQFLKEIQNKNMHTIAPLSSFNIQENITSGKGAYVIAFPNYSKDPVHVSVSIHDPSAASVLKTNLDLPFYSEPFVAKKLGNYTMSISNLGNSSINASVIFGEEEIIRDVIGMPNVVSTAISYLLLIIGVVVLSAGAIVTVLDRHKAQKMKQFGDMSDLV